MLLSQFYRGAPSHFSVGDKKKALEEARLAAQYGPGKPVNHLALAEAYLATDDKDQAVRELETVLKLPPPAEYPSRRLDRTSRPPGTCWPSFGAPLRRIHRNRSLPQAFRMPKPAGTRAADGSAGGRPRTGTAACRLPTRVRPAPIRRNARGAAFADASVPPGANATGQCADWTHPVFSLRQRPAAGKASGSQCQ